MLVALATAHPQTGYCQGMNLVAGALLEAHVRGGELPAEAETIPEPRQRREPRVTPHRARGAQRAVFWLVSALCEPAPRRSAGGAIEHQPGSRPRREAFDNWLELRELWRPGMPQLKLRVFQFDRLFSEHLPRLRAHFRDIGMAPDVLASQWFFTLFAYALPADWLPRVWDVVFADGWKAIMRLALGRLKLSVDDLLGRGLEEAGKYMRDKQRLRGVAGGVEGLLQASFDFKITRTTLAELTERFGLALLEERCRDAPRGDASADPVAEDSWLRRYGGQVDDLLADAPARALRSRLADLDETTRRDAAALRARVERIERDGADARARLDKATLALRDKRRLVGELVDAKRLAAADAARLVVVLSDDDEEELGSPAPSLWRRARGRLLGNQSLASPPPKARQPSFAPACLTVGDDRDLVRGELRATQLRAAKAEKELRSARLKLATAARDFLVAQADLDDANERKRNVEIQLLHVVNDATKRRESVLAQVAQSEDTPGLNLLRRYSDHRRLKSSDSATPPKPSPNRRSTSSKV